MSTVQEKKLPKAFKRKWVRALRSGKYKQGNSYLRDKSNLFCCLGVAAHVAGCTCFTNIPFIQNGQNIRGISKVPQVLIGTQYSANKIPGKLAGMNDGGKSFKQIADYIEKHL